MSTTIGLLSDPGLPSKLATSFAGKAPDSEPEFTTASEKLPLNEEGEVPLARFAPGILEKHRWDFVIYITELPLWRDGEAVMFEVIHDHRAALVSLPALGAVRLRSRIGKLLDGLARLMMDGRASAEFSSALRHPLHHETFQEGEGDFVLVGGRLGRLQLVSGMIRSNRPGHLITALSSSVATAIATGTFGIFYASIWDLADALHPLRLAAIAALVISAFSLWLIAHNGLWNTHHELSDPGRRRRDNTATLVTIVMSVAMLYVVLFGVLFFSGLIIIDADFLSSELEHRVGPSDYARLSCLAASLGMMAGAVGSNFDREETIREATYSRREAERRRLAERLEEG